MSKVRPKPLRFTRIKLTNWRNFQSIDVTLLQRAFVFGPNASGKSNFLDTIRFLSEIARPGSGGLQAAIAGRGGFPALRCLQARRTPWVEIEVFVGDDEDPARWHYRLKMWDPRPTRLPIVIEEIVEKDGGIVEERRKPENADALEFSQTLLEQVGLNKEFRELVEFFASCRYLHVVPQIVRDPMRARSEGEDPFGGDLLRRMKAMPKKTRLPRLQRISRALQIAVPQFSEIELVDDADGVPHLQASYNGWRKNASKQSEAAFSDGTLRLIGLLWSISEKGGPLLLEEPELSLNEAIVLQLPAMFLQMQKLSSRQVIVTTHASALTDAGTGVGLKEVHRIAVDTGGSKIEMLDANPRIRAQVEAGMTIGQAVLPLLAPPDIEKLGKLAIAG